MATEGTARGTPCHSAFVFDKHMNPFALGYILLTAESGMSWCANQHATLLISQHGVPTFLPPKIPTKAPARSRTGLNEAGSPVA